MILLMALVIGSALVVGILCYSAPGARKPPVRAPGGKPWRSSGTGL